MWTETYKGCCFPWEHDQNGHMNVRFYVSRFDEASWVYFTQHGLTHDYFTKQKKGMVVAEQRISYKSEVVAGLVLSVRSRVVSVAKKSLNILHELRTFHYGGNNRYTTAAELTGRYCHIDLDTRRAVPFPDNVYNSFKASISEKPIKI